MPFTKFNTGNLLQVPEQFAAIDKRTLSLASLISNQDFDQNIIKSFNQYLCTYQCNYSALNILYTVLLCFLN